MSREEEKKLAILKFRTGKTKEERSKAFIDYFKRNVRTNTEKARITSEHLSIFDGKVV